MSNTMQDMLPTSAKPDKWCLIKNTIRGDPVYHIFSGWYGGYLGADEWRLSTFIESVTKADDAYSAVCASGSDYRLVKSGYGMTSFQMNILNNLNLNQFSTVLTDEEAFSVLREKCQSENPL